MRLLFHPSGIEANCGCSVSLDDLLQVGSHDMYRSISYPFSVSVRWISDTVFIFKIAKCLMMTDVTHTVLGSYMLSDDRNNVHSVFCDLFSMIWIFD